jgi:hypothetical protein
VPHLPLDFTDLILKRRHQGAQPVFGIAVGVVEDATDLRDDGFEELLGDGLLDRKSVV